MPMLTFASKPLGIELNIGLHLMSLGLIHGMVMGPVVMPPEDALLRDVRLLGAVEMQVPSRT